MWEAEVQRCVTDVAAAVKPSCKNEQERRPRPSVAEPTEILETVPPRVSNFYVNRRGKSALCVLWAAGGLSEVKRSRRVKPF